MNPNILDDIFSPTQLRAMYRESVSTHKFFAKRCTFTQWVAESDLENALWMLPFTRFNLGQLPEKMSLTPFELVHSSRRVIQRIIEKNLNLSTLEINSSACEGARPLNIQPLRNLHTLKIDFDHVLNLRHIKNRYVSEIHVKSDTLTPCKIEQGKRFWQRCPAIKHVSLEV